MWTDFYKRYRTDILAVLAIVLVAGLLLGLMLNRFLTIVNHDSAIFCILAQSILKGHYLLVSEPNPQPYFTFPPFLSLQLAGLMLLFRNFDPQAMQPVFKGYIDCLFLLSLPLFYAWTRHLLGRMPAIVLTTLVAVNPIIFKYSSDILSDTPYWATSMAALFSAWRFQTAFEQKNKRTWLWFAITLFFIVISALTRQIGMALILGFLIALVFQKQWKFLILSGLVFSVTVGSWQASEHFYRLNHRSSIDSLNQQGVQEVLDKSPIKLEYVKHFLIDRPVDMDRNRLQTSPAVLLGNIRDRVVRYTKISLDQLLPPLKIKLGKAKVNVFETLPFMLAFWVLLLLGFRRFWQASRFGSAYLTLYMAVLSIYPYISPRFLLPVYPLILLCVFAGLLQCRDALAEKLASPVLKKATAVIVPLFLLLSLGAQLPDTIRWVNAGFQLKKADQGPSLRKGNAAYYRTLLWIKGNTPENSLIISRKPPVVYFYSGRRSTAFPFTAHSDKLFAYIESKKTMDRETFPNVYVFEDTVFGSSTRYLAPTIEKYRARFDLVYEEPVTHSRIWKLKS
jgi:hypothetical protein